MALRQRGYVGQIRVLESEQAWPYDKPPLSKTVLDKDSPSEPPVLISEEMAQDLDLSFELGVTVTAVNTADNTVTTADSSVIRYDNLIIATGSTPRQLPGGDTLDGVFTLRSRDDAMNIRAALENQPSNVVVIGAGFIGSEFAAVARQRGLNVTIVEAQEVPMSHLFGDKIGHEISSIHAHNGTTMITGARFTNFVGEDHVEGIALADGRVLPADLVVVGIGVVPNTAWLEDSGLPLDNGIPVDNNFLVEGQTNVYAIGDIALRTHPLLNIRARIEHWTNAGEHAEELAAILTESNRPNPQLPYVWSDQYGSTFQIIGRPSMGQVTYQHGDVASGSMFAVYTDEADKPVGAVALNDNKAISRFRRNARKNGSLEDLVSQLSPAS